MFLLIFFIDNLYELWLTLLNKTFEKKKRETLFQQAATEYRDSNKDEGFQL